MQHSRHLWREVQASCVQPAPERGEHFRRTSSPAREGRRGAPAVYQSCAQCGLRPCPRRRFRAKKTAAARPGNGAQAVCKLACRMHVLVA